MFSSLSSSSTRTQYDIVSKSIFELVYKMKTRNKWFAVSPTSSSPYVHSTSPLQILNSAEMDLLTLSLSFLPRLLFPHCLSSCFNQQFSIESYFIRTIFIYTINTVSIPLIPKSQFLHYPNIYLSFQENSIPWSQEPRNFQMNTKSRRF